MGRSRECFIKGKDGEEVFLRIWDEVENPKAVVQIFHGMAEHSERYDRFAEFLNSKNIVVYADDHRGHGKTAEKNGKLGYLGNDGFYAVVEDEYSITKLIKENCGDLPIIIFAHSFGSFVGQEYITRYSKEVSAVILSGSAKQDGIDIKLAALIAKLQSSMADEKKEAYLIDKLAFGGFNNTVKNPSTDYAWLTRDEEEQHKYSQDLYCGYISSVNFYRYLFEGLTKLYQKEKLNNIKKEMPLLVISGDKDPVGKMGKSVKRLYQQYKDLAMENVTLKLYKDGRHELLNEINKEEVYEFIYKWIEEIL